MKRPIFAAVLCAVAWIGGACGQLMTEPPPPGDDFESPFEGLSADLNAAFVAGDENFAKAFTIDEGLGPIFNNVSCEGCHPGDGRGTPALGFFRFSEGEDLALDKGGAQHQDKAIPGAPPEVLPPGVDRSFRIPPPVFGVGLIEAIPVETILSREDPDDADGDGISGRAHWVRSPDYVSAAHVGGGDGIQLRRFSRKAQVSSLLQQVVEGLADSRPDGDATGREWRAAPLWGLRLVPDFLGGQAFYMHDGQSTTLHDAIVRHGGESAASRDAYMALDQADQEALIAFLVYLYAGIRPPPRGLGTGI
ncbi:MAG: hypothetical protein F4X75_25455 [Gemmatimonadetes bacterium]|nr:hypothetical protein [Gemmatimonadota bacterium]